MKYRSDDNQSLTKAFDFMWKRGELHKGIPTFEFVEKYVSHYETISNGAISSKNTGVFFSNLNFILTSVFGSQYMAPLMYYREFFGEYRILDFLIKLDNLLTIPWLTGKRTSSTRIFILLRKLEEFGGKGYDKTSVEHAADKFLCSDYLKYEYKDPYASTELNIDELFHTLDQENWGAFAGTRINKTRYLLLKLDLLISNFNTQLQFNKNNSSVEHLIPRKIKGTSWKIQESDHTNWLHKLGNLVLLDRKKNSSLSNRTYPEKKNKYQGAIETRPNTNFIFMKYEEWNIETVQQNHQRVINILKDYYRGNSLNTLLRIKQNIQDYHTEDIAIPL